VLRIICWSLAESVAAVLTLEVLWSLFTRCLYRSPWDGIELIATLYLLPTAVAAVRRHRAALDIMVSNLWLGWTVIGWFVILVWACDSNIEQIAN
jgi:hypothetical protein